MSIVLFPVSSAVAIYFGPTHHCIKCGTYYCACICMHACWKCQSFHAFCGVCTFVCECMCRCVHMLYFVNWRCALSMQLLVCGLMCPACAIHVRVCEVCLAHVNRTHKYTNTHTDQASESKFMGWLQEQSWMGKSEHSGGCMMCEPTYAELLTMLMCYEASFTERWNGCKLYQKSNWVVFAIQALQAEIPQRPWCCMIMTSNDWRASSTLESGFKPTEDMHELHPLCSCRLNGEWRTRPHYVNIGKWTPWVLLRRWWILLCISESWKGYNLWKREGTPS